MAGIAAQACGAGLVSAAAVGDDGYESNLRRAGMRPESVSSLEELEVLRPERESPGFKRGISATLAHESLAQKRRKNPASLAC